MGRKRWENTSYFLRIDKQNFCNKLITKIKTEKEVITNPKDLLEDGRKYYMNLYSDDDSQTVKMSSVDNRLT